MELEHFQGLGKQSPEQKNGSYLKETVKTKQTFFEKKNQLNIKHRVFNIEVTGLEKEK